MLIKEGDSFGVDLFSAHTGIYAIVNKTTDTAYIGQSTDMLARWKSHYTGLESGKHSNRALAKDWHEYGANAFEFKVLELCQVSELDKQEKKWIQASEPKVYNSIPRPIWELPSRSLPTASQQKSLSPEPALQTETIDVSAPPENTTEANGQIEALDLLDAQFQLRHQDGTSPTTLSNLIALTQDAERIWKTPFTIALLHERNETAIVPRDMLQVQPDCQLEFIKGLLSSPQNPPRQTERA